MTDTVENSAPTTLRGSNPPQLRIVHVVNSLEPGGAETMLYRVAAGLNGQEFSSHVISLADIGLIGKRLIAAGIPVTALGMEPGKLRVKPLMGLVQAIRREKPDVVMGWLVPADFLSLIAGKMAGVKHVIWNIRNSAVKEAEIGRRNALLKVWGSKLSAVPSAIVINSFVGRKSHEAIGFKPKRWEVILNGFDLDFYRPNPELGAKTRRELGIPESAPVIGLIAHFRPAKNHQMFFEAARQFSKSHPDAHFVLAGGEIDVSNERLKEMAGDLWGSPNLHLMGVQADVRPLVLTMDLMSLCSFWEGFPNVVGEAMAMGVPCVVTQTSGDAANIVGEYGRVIEINDVEGCVAAWNDLISHPQDLARLGLECRERIAQKYSLDSILTQYAELFNSFRPLEN